MRRAAALMIAVLAVAALPPASARDADAPEVPDAMRAYSIVPPGQEGNVTAAELLSGDYGPHYDDQRELYASLIEDDDVTEQELSSYFHSMQFGPEGTVEETFEPTPGTTVYRDSLGHPHIYADSLTNASFALGYVSAEDRLWQMDVFRHAARGTLAELAGPGEDDAYLEMDIATRREGYTEPEIREMLDQLDDKFGEIGAQVQEGLGAYAAGVNAYIDELKTTPAAVEERPVEYEATGNPFPANPAPWTPEDTLFLVVLQLRVFGETAGGELDNAALYSYLTGRLGRSAGAKVFNDLVFVNEPRSYTSIAGDEGAFPSQNLGPIDWSSVAVPDDPTALTEPLAAESKRKRVLASLGFKAPASNAILVAGSKSATGNPLEIGAPQVGYAVPSFFMDVDVHAPGIDFRGPTVPGASALIPLGRGRDYAWSLTTGYSDAVDVRAELLCEPDGGEGSESSNGYYFNGDCRSMTARTETFIVKPTPTDPGPPRIEQHTFYRSHHGPVFARGTVDGKPVAFVKQRYFWKKEIDSVPQFLRWNTQVDSIEDFAAAAEDFTMSFNAFYADQSDIGYFHVGHYPRRTPGVHPALPVWGTGEWEWRGRFPFKRHPQAINPDQGWVVNWNNKPSLGWNNYDGIKWGSIHRVELLARGINRALNTDGSLALSDIVDVIRVAATQDVRGLYLGPRMVRWASLAGGGVRRRQGIQLVRDWVTGGAHRRNRDRDDLMDAGAAVAVFDRWYTNTVHNVFDDDLGVGAYQLVPAPVLGQSMWFDFSSYLDTLFNAKARSQLSRDYCDNRFSTRRESCRDVVVSSLRETIDELVEEQGGNPAAWTAPAEWIEFQALGAGSVERIPWQNRGTHNHVVEILGD